MKTQRTKREIIKELKFARMARVSMKGKIEEKKIELEYANSEHFFKNCEWAINQHQEVLDEQNNDIELLYKELEGAIN